MLQGNLNGVRKPIAGFKLNVDDNLAGQVLI